MTLSQLTALAAIMQLVTLGVALAHVARLRRRIATQSEQESQLFAQLEDARSFERQHVEHAREDARNFERRYDEVSAIVAGVIDEKLGWIKMYRQGMNSAGVAQSMLARDLSRVLKVANAYAVELQKHGVRAEQLRIDPRLEVVLEEFQQRIANLPSDEPPAASAALVSPKPAGTTEQGSPS